MRIPDMHETVDDDAESDDGFSVGGALVAVAAGGILGAVVGAIGSAVKLCRTTKDDSEQRLEDERRHVQELRQVERHANSQTMNRRLAEQSSAFERERANAERERRLETEEHARNDRAFLEDFLKRQNEQLTAEREHRERLLASLERQQCALLRQQELALQQLRILSERMGGKYGPSAAHADGEKIKAVTAFLDGIAADLANNDLQMRSVRTSQAATVAPAALPPAVGLASGKPPGTRRPTRRTGQGHGIRPTRFLNREQ